MLAIVEKIDAQYRKNNIILEKSKNCDEKETTNVKTTYIKCGAPFFKDALSNPAPFNEDYLHRKNDLNEFFPFDLPQTNTRWKTKEKVALINGAKQQMISHIKSQQSQKYSKEVRKTRGRIATLKFISQNQDLNNSAMLEIYKTILNDHPDFAINWNLISFIDLHSKHSVAECMGMWYSYLRPDLNREPFTEEEDCIISSTYIENNFNTWNDIAALLDNRSGLQTFVHFHSTYTQDCPSNIRWSEEEDACLLRLVEKYSINGVINWHKIGQLTTKRNKTQCYNRYLAMTKRYGVKKGSFTPTEDRKIIQFVMQFGENNFIKMPDELIPGRSKAQIRAHYNVALKHKGVVNPWTNDEDKQLVEFVENGGINRWAEISAILKTHNRLSCRTRYFTIKKYLAKNPNAKLEDVPSKTKKVTAVQRSQNACVDEEDEDASTAKPSTLKAIERFKALNPELLKMMRTTFNYDLGTCETSADNDKLLMLMWLFNANIDRLNHGRHPLMTAIQSKKFEELKNYQLNTVLLNEMIFATAHAQFLMPPNYNTVIGLRAITVKMHDDPLEEDAAPGILNQTEEFKESLEKFQKVYFSLFYWSAMLKKIDIAELNEIHFLKDPKCQMTATNIIGLLKKRELPILSGFTRNRPCSDMSSSPLPAKKRKL